MNDTDIHVGDVGTTFLMTVIDKDGVVVNVANATTKLFYFLKPNGAKIERACEYVTTGVDGKLQYITIANDIDMAGQWTIQGFVEIPIGQFFTEKKHFHVLTTVKP